MARQGEGFVKGSFSFKACRGNNFMAMITIDPFQVAGVDGWGWVGSNAWLDLSDLENPPGFTFPESYGDSALAAVTAGCEIPGRDFTWKPLRCGHPVSSRITLQPTVLPSVFIMSLSMQQGLRLHCGLRIFFPLREDRLRLGHFARHHQYRLCFQYLQGRRYIR